MPKRSNVSLRKKLVFSALATVAFFVLAEAGLWLAGVTTLIEREDPSQGFSGLLSVFERDGDVYRTRPANTPRPFNDQSFAVEKPAAGFRVFTLGGSSAYGYPGGAEAAFSSLLGEALAKKHPDRVIESINVGGVSYGMHRVSIVARQMLQYEPDVLVIYAGHNEFIEPAFYAALKSRVAGRAWLEHALAHSRIYTLARSALGAMSAKEQNSLEAIQVRLQSPRTYTIADKERIVADYRSRLKELLVAAEAAGVRVVLATVPCNLRDWPPAASLAEDLAAADRGRWTEALVAGRQAVLAASQAAAPDGKAANGTAIDTAVNQLEVAVHLAPDHAESNFLLGKAYELAERWTEADVAYRRACDADAAPNRRLTAINTATAELGELHGATVLDLDAQFAAESKHGLVGDNLIDDFVHPGRRGHQIIAWHVWDAIERAGWLGEMAAADRALFDELIADRKTRVKPRNAEWFFTQAVALQHRGSYDQAIAKYRQALEIDAGHVATLANLGSVLTTQGQYAEAVKLFEQALAIEADLDWVHNSLGLALIELERYEQAEQTLARALQLNPDLAEAHANLGLLAARRQQFEVAADHYQEAVKRNPDSAGVQSSLASVLNSLQRHDEALDACDRALRLQPDSATAHHNRGNALQGLGRLEEAVAAYAAALQLSPNLAVSLTNRGRVLTALGRPAEAADDFVAAAQLRPEDPESHHAAATALQASGRIDEAISHFRRALQLNPKDTAVRNNFGNCLLMAGKLSDAVQQYRRVLRGNPAAAGTHNNLGFALLRSGELDEAAEHLKRAVKLQPNYAEAYYNLGLLEMERRAFPRALEQLSRAISLRSDYVEALVARADLYRRQVRSEAALKDLDAAIRVAPQAAVLYLKRGEVKAYLDRHEAALADFDAAVERGANLPLAFVRRGQQLESMGRYAQAAKDYQRAAELAPHRPEAHNNLAWLLATAPQEAVRDGERAIKHAEQALQLAARRNFGYMDTLAAAYAEAGRYEDAQRVQSEAIELAPESNREALAARLELYRAQQPYRQEPAQADD
ncbi:MAG: tetratricopeptide repeat protein [Planctomycetota bacterium]|nr:MAG: tetratricopeptide repeat protein [Planctomycetota bacterium]REK38448.1 MAG: tetratricopeptide repeat protein [Planctomycetota bacterium]